MARAEVEDLRRQADTEIHAMRAQRRQEAEIEARQIVQSARDEAEIIRTEAVRSAEAVEDAARRREQWIDEGIRLMVERAEWARRGLREVITRLDDFVVRAPAEWPDTPPIPSAEASEPPPAARMAGPPSEPEPEPMDAELPRPNQSQSRNPRAGQREVSPIRRRAAGPRVA